jgi:hypothetical protein
LLEELSSQNNNNQSPKILPCCITTTTRNPFACSKYRHAIHNRLQRSLTLHHEKQLGTVFQGLATCLSQPQLLCSDASLSTAAPDFNGAFNNNSYAKYHIYKSD